MRGQVIFSMNIGIACSIASSMMGGFEITQLDDISKSAIAELANMILGNAATIFSTRGIGIEITPPSMVTGDNIQISTSKTKTICVPIQFDNGGMVEIDISITN